MDFKPYFRAYEELVKSAETGFHKISNEYPSEVNCKPGCSDCCHALFDVTLIEAMYISTKFREKYKDFDREKILDRANIADREIHRIKRNAFKAQKKGATEIEIIGQMAMERVKCPLLNEEKKCDLYEFRPINCRVYGVPTETAGTSHICGRTGFVQGQKYPTIKMDKVYSFLHQVSTDMVGKMKTKYPQMGDMLMPLSMALITTFNDDFLGIGAPEEEAKEA